MVCKEPKHQQPLPHVIAADAVDFVLEFNKASPCKKVLRQQSLSMGSEPTHKGFNIIQVDAECYANENPFQPSNFNKSHKNPFLSKP
jgi:hypothetical protein